MGPYPHLMKQVSTTALAAALLAAGSAGATAQSLTVTDISLAGGAGLSVTIPSIETVDANLDEAAIRAIFGGDADAADISELDAASIRIPEITLRMEVPAESGAAGTAVIVYRDLELTDVTDGVAAAAAMGGAEMEGANGGTFTMGRMSSGLLDLGNILAFYGVGEQTGGDAMVPIYRDFVFEGGTFTAPAVNCEIGTATIAEFRARPLRSSFADLMAAAQQLETAEAAGEAPAPEAIAGMIAYYADFFTAFESTPGELASLSCSGSDETGNEFNLAAGPLVMGGFDPGIYPELAINGLRIDNPGEGWLEFDNFTWKAMDFTAPIAVLEAAGDTLDEAWFTANWRKLMPSIAGFSLTGLDFDVPDPETPDQRIVASIGSYDVSLGDYFNGIPGSLSSTASDINFAVPATGETANLFALGIERLNLSSNIDLRWDEASNTVAVEAFSLDAADLGSFSISGTVANATADLFSEDIDVAAAALTGLTVTDLRIDLDNNGILPILVTLAAIDAEQEPESLHAGVVGLATALPIALLGASPDSIQVGTSIAAFLSGTPQLSLTVTSKDPAGIGLADLAAAESDPSMLTSKINVTATTAGEPQNLVFPAVPAPQAEAPADDAPAAKPRSGKLDGKQ